MATEIYPRDPHCALIVGQTGCGKSEYVLNLLEGPYRGVFANIVILCPTLTFNKAYRNRPWIWRDPRIYLINPGAQLHEWLRWFYKAFQGHPTLYVIDDMAASKALTKKKDMLSELAFSGRHASQSVWVLSQKYNSVCTDFREQTKWVAIFYCKDRDSLSECLHENYVIPTDEERARVRQLLASIQYAKLILKTDVPTAYQVILPSKQSSDPVKH